MANTIRIKRRTLASGTGVPGSLAQGELAYSEHDQKLHIGVESSGIHVIAGTGTHVTWPGAGIIVQTAAAAGATPPTVAARTIAGTASTVTVSNGDGISGNPTIDLADNTVMPGVAGMLIPQGTTAQQGATEGQFRYNTTDDIIEWRSASGWVRPDTAGGEANQAAFSIVTGDTGTATSDIASDTLVIAGGTNISTTATDGPETLTINLFIDADIPMAGQKITGLGAPTNDTDAATKGYVDAQSQGLDVKASVRAATTVAGTLSTDYENLDTIDGVTLATNDRILIKNQAAPADNGIYIVQASGAPARATDFDEADEVTPGSFTFVEEGTANADSGWVLSTDGAITVGSTALNFEQFSGAGQVTAGNGLTKTGNTLDVGGTASRISVTANAVDIDAAYVGQTSITTLGTVTTGTWGGTAITPVNGGTGLTTYTTGDILYASAANTLSKLAVGATDTFLQIVGGVPTWSTTLDGGTF